MVEQACGAVGQEQAEQHCQGGGNAAEAQKGDANQGMAQVAATGNAGADAHQEAAYGQLCIAARRFSPGPKGAGEAGSDEGAGQQSYHCLLYTSPSPRDGLLSRMPSSA